jgi:riboflavin synthase
MFTGIVEEVGKIVSLETSPGESSLSTPGSSEVVAPGARPGGRILIAAKTVLQDTRLGDSIMVNGACLTVSSMSGERLCMDLLAETLSRTNLGRLRPGDPVNLERSLTPRSRLGGHFVLGHVDGTGTVTRFERSHNDWVLEVEAPSEISAKLSPKGSIAVDGISLTIVSTGDRRFAVHVIPHTLDSTNLKSRKVGDQVNIEVDVFARYLYDFLERQSRRSGVTEELLRRAGFE